MPLGVCAISAAPMPGFGCCHCANLPSFAISSTTCCGQVEAAKFAPSEASAARLNTCASYVAMPVSQSSRDHSARASSRLSCKARLTPSPLNGGMGGIAQQGNAGAVYPPMPYGQGDNRTQVDRVVARLNQGQEIGCPTREHGLEIGAGACR